MVGGVRRIVRSFQTARWVLSATLSVSKRRAPRLFHEIEPLELSRFWLRHTLSIGHAVAVDFEWVTRRDSGAPPHPSIPTRPRRAAPGGRRTRPRASRAGTMGASARGSRAFRPSPSSSPPSSPSPPSISLAIIAMIVVAIAIAGSQRPSFRRGSPPGGGGGSKESLTFSCRANACLLNGPLRCERGVGGSLPFDRSIVRASSRRRLSPLVVPPSTQPRRLLSAACPRFPTRAFAFVRGAATAPRRRRLAPPWRRDTHRTPVSAR